MHFSTLLSLLPLTPGVLAAPSSDLKRATSSSCPSYTIINSRGTGEPQGPSAGFLTMNTRVLAALPGGKIYNTIYPAGITMDPDATDLLNKITSTLASNPSECFILQGYSQGALLTLSALPKLSPAAFDAVKGVLLIGDPAHESGLACNVDNSGGTLTRDVDGAFARIKAGVPAKWVPKTLDVCIFGDGVCDTMHGFGVNAQHLAYPVDPATQRLGERFLERQLA